MTEQQAAELLIYAATICDALEWVALLMYMFALLLVGHAGFLVGWDLWTRGTESASKRVDSL